MASRIAHANLQVADADAAVEFYGHLGLTRLGCLRLDPTVVYYVGSPDSPNVTFELVHNPRLESRSPGSGHVALAVGDLDALVESLAAAGITPEKPPYRPLADRPLRVCFVRDPDGHRIELIEGDFDTPQDEPPTVAEVSQ